MSQERKWPSPVMAFFLAVLGLRLQRDLAKRPLCSLSSSEMMMIKRKNSTRLEMRQAVAMIWSKMASNSSSCDLKHSDMKPQFFSDLLSSFGSDEYH